MHVKDQMTHEVFSCRPEDTLAHAARIMWEHDCGAVPVTDVHGVLCGVVTDRDACMASWTRGQRLDEILVGSAMAKQITVCRGDESLAVAEQRMAQSQVRRLPVVDAAGRLVGILSACDLLRAVAGHGTGGDGVVRTLAAISGHRPAAAKAAAAPAAKVAEAPAVSLPRPAEARKVETKAAEAPVATKAVSSKPTASKSATKAGKAKGKGRK